MALENIIPSMTSNTAPSGVASASSELSSSFQAHEAMDGFITSYWVSSSGDTSGYLQYAPSSSERVVEYKIRRSPVSGTEPVTFSLKASNTGAFSGEETTLDTQTSITWGADYEKQYSFTNTNTYDYYRLDIGAINGGSDTRLAEFALYKDVVIPEANASVEINATANAFDNTKGEATASVEVSAEAFAQNSVPIATANLAVTVSADAYPMLPETEMFTFKYTIQQSQPEAKFKFVYSIEQPKTAVIIKREEA